MATGSLPCQRIADTMDSWVTITESSTNALMCAHANSPTAAECSPSAIVRPVILATTSSAGRWRSQE
jgi:hypothetical protein